jgi:hypothetical protein
MIGRIHGHVKHLAPNLRTESRRLAAAAIGAER